MRQGFLLLALLAFVGGASGTEYYLATTGDNGNTGLSIAQAWLTPSYAVTQLHPGATLWVVDGIYYDSSTSALGAANVGNETHWVTIRAYNGTPIWDGGGTYTIGLKIWYADTVSYSPGYVEVDGIHIRKYGCAEVAVRNVCNLIFRNCTFTNSSVALPTWTSLIDMGGGVRDVVFNNCTFIDTGDFCLNFIGGSEGDGNKLYNIEVTNCHFEKTIHHGAIQICEYASEVIIANNTFVDCYCGFNTYFHNIATDPDRQSNILTKDNTFTDITYYAISYMGTVDSLIINNTINGVGSSAFCHHGYCNNVSTINNTVLDALRIHDDYNTWGGNIFVKYENNTYGSLTSGSTYLLRAGGNLTIVDDAHQPSFRIDMNNAEKAGNTTIEYLNGRVFGYDIVIGSTYTLTPPIWHVEKSNMSFGSNEDVNFDIDIIPYNITLVPTNNYLKDVIINRESNSTYDITNITVNSSVSSNPTWINATMQNATNTYNVSIDGVYTTQVVSDSNNVVRYKYASSWSSHVFEFEWHSVAGFSGPPDPINLANTTGDTWVRHSWGAGSGNITDAYNVSIASTWYNITNTYHNNTGMAGGAWSNITVWAWNTTGGLSAGSGSQDTQNSGGGWSPSITGIYFNTTSMITITTKTDGTNLFSRTITQNDCNASTSFRLVVTT